MRVLVTGAAGFIGSNLCWTLAQRGATLFALDDLSVGKEENLRDFRAEILRGDIRTFPYETLGKLDAVFHQAAITDTTVTDARRISSINVEATRRILDYAKKSRCPKVVYASSAAVYGKGTVPMKESHTPSPANLYGESKSEMDRLAMEFAKENPEISLVGLRYFNVYGPRETHKGGASSMIYQLHRQISSGKRPRIFKWGEQYRDFIYVKDVVSANLKALEFPRSGIFNVGMGNPTTFNKIIEILNSLLESHAPTEYFDNPYPFYQEKTFADTQKAKDLLRFEAQVGPEEGIADYLNALRTQTDPR